MNLIPLIDPRDPRLLPFWALPQRKSGGAVADGLFIAEGRLVVERLLRSPYTPAALLIADSRRPWVEGLLGTTAPPPPDLPIYILPDAVISDTVGFEFHSGIMGCGRRELPSLLRAEMERWFQAGPSGGEAGQVTRGLRQAIVVLPAMNSAENLGSIIRSAQGLGAAGMILGPQSADHLARRVIRVSMGHALAFPCWRTPDWRTDLQRLRSAGFRLIGIEHHARMVPLASVRPAPRQALVLGNEFSGLDAEVLDQMDQVVGIPMANGVDSLNVAVTAAIALHHFLADV